MRRAKPISVVVKAPSRGLVTRLPSLSADLLPTQSGEIQSTILSTAAYQRASSAAQNVRFEDGVVCAAPGYERIILSSELLQGIVAYWPLTEATGTRFDATPAHLDLSDVPDSTGLLDVTSTGGILGGTAALFPSGPTDTTQTAPQDLFSVDSALGSGFINPLAERLPNDLFSFDTALGSGAYSSTAIIADAPEDSMSLDAALDSGAYTETVVIADAPEDSMSLDAALDSGTYFLSEIVTDSPEDLMSLDAALTDSTYTETIVITDAPEDSMSFDSALRGGSYP